MKRFDEILNEVEQNHIGWFRSRKSKFGDPHDSLKYHVVKSFDDKIGFEPDSDLPERIRADVLKAFENNL